MIYTNNFSIKFLGYLLIFLLFTPKLQARPDQKEHDFKCLAHIHKEMAPYHGTPSVRAHMEGYSLQKHPQQDVFFWDTLDKDGKTTTRTIVTKEGYITCKIGEGIDVNNVKFNDKALKRGDADVLSAGSFMSSILGSDINCKKISDDDGGLRAQMVMSKYLGTIPEFYREKTDDLAISIRDPQKRYEALDPISYISDLDKNCTGGILATINTSWIRRHSSQVITTFRNEFGVGSSPTGGGSGTSAGGTQ